MTSQKRKQRGMNIPEGRILRSSRIIGSETSCSDDDTAANQLDNAINLNVSRIAKIIDLSSTNDISVFDPLSEINQDSGLNPLEATAIGGTGANAVKHLKISTLKNKSNRKEKKTVKTRKAKAVEIPVFDYALLRKEFTKLLVSGRVLRTPSLHGGLINSNADGSIPKGGENQKQMDLGMQLKSKNLNEIASEIKRNESNENEITFDVDSDHNARKDNLFMKNQIEERMTKIVNESSF